MDCIDYVGIVDSNEKYKLLASHHILALPSYYRSEAIPLCIIEAMRMGCCIITTHYKYLPYLVKDKENGFLVDIKSSSSLTFVIDKYCFDCDRMKKISDINKSVARRLYSEDSYQRNIVNYVMKEEGKCC